MNWNESEISSEQGLSNNKSQSNKLQAQWSVVTWTPSMEGVLWGTTSGVTSGVYSRVLLVIVASSGVNFVESVSTHFLLCDEKTYVHERELVSVDYFCLNHNATGRSMQCNAPNCTLWSRFLFQIYNVKNNTLYIFFVIYVMLSKLLEQLTIILHIRYTFTGA